MDRLLKSLEMQKKYCDSGHIPIENDDIDSDTLKDMVDLLIIKHIINNNLSTEYFDLIKRVIENSSLGTDKCMMVLGIKY